MAPFLPTLALVSVLLSSAEILDDGVAAGVSADDMCETEDCGLELRQLRARGKQAVVHEDATAAVVAAGAAGSPTGDDGLLPKAAAEGKAMAGANATARANATGPAFMGQLYWVHHSSKCLDVLGGRAVNGARLGLWDCLDGYENENQIFIWRASEGKIRWAKNPRFCVDIHDHENFNGNYVQLWECLEGDYDQWFDVNPSGRGFIRWWSDTSMCLDVKNQLTHNGNQIQLWECAYPNTHHSFGFDESEA